MNLPFVKSRFTKINQPRSFGYIPRYYDPLKEDLNQRVEGIKKDYGVSEVTSEETSELQMRARFQRKIEETRGGGNNGSKRLFRSLIILGGLVGLAYYLIVNMDRFLSYLLN